MPFPRVFFAANALLLLGAGAARARALEKWFHFAQNLLVDENVARTEVLFQRAAAAGYTRVLLSDSKFARLGQMDQHEWMNAARATPQSVVGAMFTPWRNDYAELEGFAAALKKAEAR